MVTNIGKKVGLAGVVICYSLMALSAETSLEQSAYDLRSSSPQVRAAATEYLKTQHSSAANDILLAAMAEERNPGLRARLIEALDVNASSAAFSAAADAVFDKNPHVAQSAVIALGGGSDSARVTAVLEKVIMGKSVPEQVKQGAVNALGFHSSTDSVRILDYVAANTGNPEDMRQLAVQSMGRIGTKDAAARIKKYRNDKSKKVSGTAKKAAAIKTKK